MHPPFTYLQANSPLKQLAKVSAKGPKPQECANAHGSDVASRLRKPARPVCLFYYSESLSGYGDRLFPATNFTCSCGPTSIETASHSELGSRERGQQALCTAFRQVPQNVPGLTLQCLIASFLLCLFGPIHNHGPNWYPRRPRILPYPESKAGFLSVPRNKCKSNTAALLDCGNMQRT